MKKLNCILLIDDNVDDNYFHSLTIKKANAADHIKSVVTGAKAIEYLKKAKEGSSEYPIPDLIFLDINMPGLNGFEFLEKATEKKLFETRKYIIIVMLTSSLNPGDEILAKKKFAEEIKEFLNKPLTASMLKEIIEKYFTAD